MVSRNTISCSWIRFLRRRKDHSRCPDKSRRILSQALVTPQRATSTILLHTPFLGEAVWALLMRRSPTADSIGRSS